MIKGKKQSKTASELISPAKFLLPTLVWLVPIDTCVQCIRTVQESPGSLLPHTFLKDSTKPAKVKQKPAQKPLGRNHKPIGFWQKPNLFTCISVLFDLWHNSHEGWKSASLERGPWKRQWWLPGVSSASQEPALLLFFALFPGIWRDHVRNTQVRFLTVSLRAAGADAGLTLCHQSWPGAQWAAEQRRQAVTGLGEPGERALGWGTSPPCIHCRALRGVFRQGSLQVVLSHW